MSNGMVLDRTPRERVGRSLRMTWPPESTGPDADRSEYRIIEVISSGDGPFTARVFQGYADEPIGTIVELPEAVTEHGFRVLLGDGDSPAPPPLAEPRTFEDCFMALLRFWHDSGCVRARRAAKESAKMRETQVDAFFRRAAEQRARVA